MLSLLAANLCHPDSVPAMTPVLTTPGLLRRLASLVYESLLIGALLMLASAVFTPLIALVS